MINKLVTNAWPIRIDLTHATASDSLSHGLALSPRALNQILFQFTEAFFQSLSMQQNHQELLLHLGSADR
jgi:hypothetical protein